jgi:hypothetical protein
VHSGSFGSPADDRTLIALANPEGWERLLQLFTGSRSAIPEEVANLRSPGAKLITLLRRLNRRVQYRCHSSRAHLTERSSERPGGCSGERLGVSSLGEGRPYCSALGRFKYGLTGKAIIQIAIASPASSDTTSIILST